MEWEMASMGIKARLEQRQTKNRMSGDDSGATGRPHPNHSWELHKHTHNHPL